MKNLTNLIMTVLFATVALILGAKTAMVTFVGLTLYNTEKEASYGRVCESSKV